jgi:RNA polymerase sigma-70 factor (ECF subfamily)
MDEQEFQSHLSQIQTSWSMLFQMHQGDGEAVPMAQRLLMQRYGGAVYRYLLSALRDPDAAEELAQEFALRFLRGDFRRADPERGRFRDFLKTAVLNLIVDHYRRRSSRPQALPESGLEPAAESAEISNRLDREFLDSWRSELLTRSWDRLSKVQEQTGQLYYTVLRYRAEHPEMRSGDMAGALSAQLGKPLTAAGIRQTLHRAREKFADFLLDEVVHSLNQPTTEQLEQELITLGLLEYCRPALDRRGRKN